MFGEMKSLNSSNLLGAAYDDEAQILTVEFRSGSRYSYSGVPQSVAEGLMAASSPGSYFHRHIKNSYPAG